MATDYSLLSAAAATGSAVAVNRGYYSWSAWGTWDGATAQLQWSPDSGTTWFSVVGASLTANGTFTDIPLGYGSARVAISSAGGTTSLTSIFRGIR
jgi:hypothetical protein